MSEGPRWDVEGRGWPLAAHSRFVEAAGLRWHVQQLGSGPPLLLLHGTGAATHSWRDLAPLLARRFDVVALDLPGHGFTRGQPRGGLTLVGMADAIRGLLTSLELAPRLVVGHSAGAAIAIRCVLDGLAVDGVVGLSPALTPFPGLAAKLFPTLARLLFVNPLAAHAMAALARRPGEIESFLPRATGSRIDRAGADCYRRLLGNSGHVGAVLRMMAGWELETFAAALPALAVPLLLVHGADDPAVPLDAVRRAASAIPEAEIEVLPGLGHLAHEEQPERVAALIERFAAQVGVLQPEGAA